jgi:hypothetical protein
LTLPFTGKYKCIYNINWGSDINGYGSVEPPLGISKRSSMYLAIGGVPVPGTGDDAALGSTGSAFSPVFEDHYLESFFTANEGDQLSLAYAYETNAGPVYNTWPDSAGYPQFPWPADARAVVKIAVTVQLVG